MQTYLSQQDENLKAFIAQKGFPCVGAKTALHKEQIHHHHYGSLDDSADNTDILSDLYAFIERFDISKHMFSSFVCTFEGPWHHSERQFERLLWDKLQQLHDVDCRLHGWDSRVSQNPEHDNFSFSLGGHAFFIVCLNPVSRRKSRRFESPTIVFNLHQQFDQLRDEGKFVEFRDHIRKRDTLFSGSDNPMLDNHGSDSEAKQYSGRQLEQNWQCPFHPTREHVKDGKNSTT
ncbi:guanitoxin biosynthesis heme-dependent pre-guanitoxin N-hydroxylase GntA [Salinimonas chungwhensis]|uniref:guanitoxin biosynthesis heme-dependent pre-guanitoxin N-hydroxylase GntA n=1 Tax=Salinimonas chungwhensis TaxID=265425 RepID=UPI000365D9D3|nr:guanitoxin biosynthesis heme-dependent pre-guanitoxin N-hydroxylase GntA [Salinimonas chungwhensis]